MDGARFANAAAATGASPKALTWGAGVVVLTLGTTKSGSFGVETIVSLVHPTEGNEVFVQLPERVTDALVRHGCRFQRGWRHEPPHHRFVCSWATTDEHVDAVAAIALAAVRPQV